MQSLIQYAVHLFLVGFLIALSPTAQAQQQDPDLPDIAPREVEIRGEGAIALPTLERQPIRTLAPPPALLNRPGQMPRVLPDTLAPLRLPPRTTELTLPEIEHRTASPSPHGTFEATGGRYWSRWLEGRIEWPFSTQTHMHGAFSYHGTEGHQPFTSSTDPKSSSDLLEGRWSFTTGTEAWAVTTEVGGMLTDYALYGVFPPLGRPPGFLPERQGLDTHIDVEVAGFRTNRADLTAAIEYRGTRYETTTPTSDLGERTSQWLSGRLSAQVPTSLAAWYADADLGIAGLDRSAFTAGDRAFADGEAGLRFHLTPRTDVDVGLHGMVFHESAQSGTPREGTFLAPAIDVRFQPASTLEIYARNAPDLDPHRLPSLFRTNPYLVSQPALQPTVRTVDAEGGLRWNAAGTQVTAFGGFAHAPIQRFFRQASSQDTNFEEGFSEVDYAKANIAQGGIRMNVMVPGSIQIALSGIARRSRLTQSEEPIPYFASLVGKMSALYFFERGEVEAEAELLGPRPSKIGGDNEVAAFLDLDLRAEYQIAPPFGFVLQVQNAIPGEQERWQRYPQPPLLFSLGVQATW